MKDVLINILVRIGWFVLIIGLMILMSALFLHIDPDHVYGFWGGVWHGFLAIGNWILSLFDGERVIKAPLHTSGYNWGFWLSVIHVTVVSVFAKLD